MIRWSDSGVRGLLFLGSPSRLFAGEVTRSCYQIVIVK